MKKKIKDILLVIKNKLIRRTTAVFYIIFIIIIGCVILVVSLSVNVLDSNEIEDRIKNKTVVINDNKIKITDDNLINLNVISRETKKDVSDKVNIKIKLRDGGKVESIEGTVVFNYENNMWKYNNSIFENVADISEGKDLDAFVEESFKKNGFKTTDGRQIYSGIINKVSNIEFDDNSIYSGKNFTASVILYNGVFFQKCKVKGEVGYDDNSVVINNVEFTSKDKMYKENKVNDLVIKDIALNEVSNGGVFIFEDKDRYMERYVNLAETKIKEFKVKDYIIREDKTIRANIEGKADFDMYQGEYTFDGIVIIAGKLSDGNSENAKEIEVYDVPFSSVDEQSVEEDEK